MKLVSGVVDHCPPEHIPHDLLGAVRNLGSKCCPSSRHLRGGDVNVIVIILGEGHILVWGHFDL